MAERSAETGFRVTALCDRNPGRMVEACTVIQQQYANQGVEVAPRLYDKGLNLIADPGVDLVVITSITDTHREFAVPALHSGKKVYCDKPLAHNVEDAIAIVETDAIQRDTHRPESSVC